MAEVVQYHLEQLVTILTAAKKVKIFTREEVRCIVNKLRSYEYSIQKSKKSKDDYIKYVNYLISVIELIRARKKKSLHSLKLKEIEVRLASHIKKLFRNVVYKNQEDVDLWFKYIGFLKWMSTNEDIGKVYMRMLQVHSDKGFVWVLAAKYQWKEKRSSDMSRNILQQGLRHLPESIELWNAYFRMELNYADFIRSRRKVLTRDLDSGQFKDTTKVELPKDEDDVVLTGQVAVIVAEKAMENFPDKPFIGKRFVDTLNKFEPGLRTIVKKEIVRLMKEHHPNSIETLMIKAGCCMDETEENPQSLSERLAAANQIYRDAINVSPSSEKWEAFIGFNLQQVPSNIGTVLTDLEEKILKLMQECWDSGLMSHSLFIHWVHLARKTDDFDKLEKILKAGSDKWPENSDIWFLRLSILSENVDIKKETEKLFFKAFKQVKEPDLVGDKKSHEHKFLPQSQSEAKTVDDIWKLFTDWISETYPINRVVRILEQLYLDILQSNRDLKLQRRMSGYVKPQLLRKVSQLQPDGLSSARSYFDKYKILHPIVPEFFQTMLDIELAATPVDYQRTKSVFEQYVQHFGSSNHKIWIDYCSFEIKYGQSRNLGTIHIKATRTLQNADTFIAEYSLLQNSLTVGY
ncbi:U3 small nucleolar RNA-associated protein 6 homolog [Brevipalpus obovatus]|uniref:U3 small nucleolar RNA-associated protein 6 homolog n=1 Tax=Brevipalpus obovatus TaxID=246614 RepID=UPI003D9EE974